MKTFPMRVLYSATLGAALLAATPSFAQSKSRSNEHPVELSQVPAAARDAAQQELGYSNISGVNEKEVNGRKVYEFKSKDASKTRHQVDVTGDGRLVKGPR
jgi:hypothetical protein